MIVEPISDRSRDILLMTYTTYSLTNNVHLDSVLSFYSDVLSGYDYDIYLHIDSASGKDCTVEPFRCIDWHDFMPYKMVIIDDGMSELVLSDFYEDATAGFERYLWSGGKLA